MPRTALTVLTPKGPFPGTVAADDLDYTYAVGDTVNNNSFPATGRELLLIENVNVGAQTVTFLSVADTFKRTADITAYSVGPSEFAVFWFGSITGWKQTDGNIYINPGHADVKMAVLKIPATT